MGNLTRENLYYACKKHKYVLLRSDNGVLKGINCKIAFLNQLNHIPKDNTETYYVSYKECSFNEYINHKMPFIKTNINTI